MQTVDVFNAGCFSNVGEVESALVDGYGDDDGDGGDDDGGDDGGGGDDGSSGVTLV